MKQELYEMETQGMKQGTTQTQCYGNDASIDFVRSNQVIQSEQVSG